MKTRFGTAIAAVAAAGAFLTIAPAAAHASTPVIGKHCSPAESGNLRYTSGHQSTLCVYVGHSGGYKWVRTVKVDPKVRHAGTPCSGKTFRLARSPQGKGLMCDRGRWVSARSM
ncbi:hypothetical protein AAFP30_12040 [Gordonia sp. CPCC 205515]|uniref:hypothetical protein n=1 Tax=Gordonia sp. CPCC 205515 TaxID=3140791 RepID=UPI003AF406AF